MPYPGRGTRCGILILSIEPSRHIGLYNGISGRKAATSVSRRFLALLPAIYLSITMLAGCSGLYYKTMESFGSPKRDILKSRVQSAREDQEKAKEQFASAFEQFQALTKYDGGELEKKYRKLSTEYDRCGERAKAVRERVDSIENVGKALFKEWEGELKQYKREDLRAASEKQLRETRQRYDKLIVTMRAVESKMNPVLEAFGDQVLFLKHNLNAQAVASLEGSLQSLESDVGDLMRDMDQSIREAEEFVQQMKSTS